MIRLVSIALVVVACAKKSDAPAKQEPPVAVAPAVPSDAAAAARARTAPTKDQLAAYHQHMTAGWAFEKQHKWAEATPEFEAALAAVEADQRALGELGWSAMNSGDFAKARKADLQAVRVAIDPKVKAAALYNFGLVLEKTGDKVGAVRSFTESLRLRPNKAVAAELAGLGAKPEVETPLCEPKDDPCACVVAAAFGAVDPEAPPSCEIHADPRIPVSTFKEILVKQEPWSWSYLLDEHQNLVAVVGGGLDRLRVYSETTLEKAELRTISGHQVLRIETKEQASETSVHDDDSMDTTEDTTVAATICIVGDATTPTRCPLRDVPLSHVQDEHPPTTAELAIADDGTATVKLVKGASTAQLDALVGPHKLW